MTQRGELFADGPQACPFIALELDRDRRSDKPDYRHRCFAEPTPQPRAIAHQEQYCLSPDFAACPIFQGWAMRAAARPVPVPQGYEGRARSDQPPPPAAPMPPASIASSTAGASNASPAQPALPLDAQPVVPQPGESWPADAFAPSEQPDAEQIPVFETPSLTVPGSVPEVEMPAAEAAGPGTSADTGTPPDWSSTSANMPAEPNDEPPVPGFLASRSERAAPARPRSSRPEVPFRETVSREDLVPSWDLTDRYGADAGERRSLVGRPATDDDGGGGGDRFGGFVTMIAVIAILALGVLGVIFLPGMLAGHAPAATATPTFSTLPTGLVTPSLPPSATGTPLVTALPTAEITPAPSPEATPRLYRIKSTDNSLTAIAHRFGLTLRQLLDANPQITDPDRIQVGQVITIPEPPPTPAPS
jgi:LysM repeat protein